MGSNGPRSPMLFYFLRNWNSKIFEIWLVLWCCCCLGTSYIYILNAVQAKIYNKVNKLQLDFSLMLKHHIKFWPCIHFIWLDITASTQDLLEFYCFSKRSIYYSMNITYLCTTNYTFQYLNNLLTLSRICGILKSNSKQQNWH